MSTYDELPVSDRADTAARFLTGAGLQRTIVFPYKTTAKGWEDLRVSLLTDGRVLVVLPPAAASLQRLVVGVDFFATIAREFGEEPRP